MRIILKPSYAPYVWTLPFLILAIVFLFKGNNKTKLKFLIAFSVINILPLLFAIYRDEGGNYNKYDTKFEFEADKNYKYFVTSSVILNNN